MAAAAKALMAADMDGITRHESALTAYALDRLRSLPAVTVYGPNNPVGGDRVGVIAFNLRGVHHALVAAILACEGGIGVRSGCFCAQPYVMRLLRSRHQIKRAGIASTSPAIDRRSRAWFASAWAPTTSARTSTT